MDREPTSGAVRPGGDRSFDAPPAPGARAFVEAVEARVTALRGRGYALSGVETHVVLTWWQEGHGLAEVLGVVEQVSARAKRRGAAGFGLDTVTRHLAEGAKRRAEASSTAEQETFEVTTGRLRARLRAVIEGVGARLPEGVAREALRGAWATLGRAEGEDPWALAARLDAALLGTLTDAAPSEVLASAETTARQAESWATSSPRAQAEAEALARARAVRSYFAVPELLEALLHP